MSRPVSGAVSEPSSRLRVTVLIPTRERCDVLADALRTVTAQDYDRLEIVVSDNASRDGTRAVVEAAGDPRLRYINPGRRLSMTEHWEFALGHVRDGWVTILGDDDGLLPGATARITELAVATGVRAIRSAVCSYAWPSLTGEPHGRLTLRARAGHERRRTDRWLARAMSGRAQYPELPMLYNGGWVHTSVLDRLKRRDGRVYRSCIPDVYSAIAIARELDEYLYVREPLAINGRSRHSTGTAQFGGKPDDGRAPDELFRSEGNIPFHPAVPLSDDGNYPLSLQALVYESYLQSAPGRTEVRPAEHAHQLEVILATADRHHAEVLAWARRFAALHGLDLDAARRRARRRRAFLRLGALADRLRSAAVRVTVDSGGRPVRNVYEAAMAAGEILEAESGPVAAGKRVVGRAARKVAGVA